MGQLSLVMCFFGCSCAASADMAASCLGSVYNPFHSSIKSLGLTSTWQHDGWVWRTSFHQQADRGGGREGPTRLLCPHTPVQTGRPCVYTAATEPLPSLLSSFKQTANTPPAWAGGQQSHLKLQSPPQGSHLQWKLITIWFHSPFVCSLM